jgi:hypothetical protein
MYGVVCDDPESAALINRILMLTSWMSLLALLSILLSLFSGVLFFVGLVPALLIPCCGYSGAVNRSRGMLTFFIAANVVFSLVFIVTLILGLATAGRDLTGGYGAVYWVSIIIGAAMCALQIAGAVYGYRLLQCKHFAEQEGGVVFVSPPAGTAPVYYVQEPPVYYAQPQPVYYPGSSYPTGNYPGYPPGPYTYAGPFPPGDPFPPTRTGSRSVEPQVGPVLGAAAPARPSSRSTSPTRGGRGGEGPSAGKGGSPDAP